MCLSFFPDKGRSQVRDIFLRRLFSAKDNLPTSVCCFRQSFVVSNKRFVGNSRASKLDNSHDGIPHSCAGVNAAKWPEIRLTGTHIQGPSTWYRLHTDILQRYILSRLADIRRGFETYERVWITASPKDSTRLSYCICTWKEGCLFINSNIAGYSFSVTCSKRADPSFGEFDNGN